MIRPHFHEWALRLRNLVRGRKQLDQDFGDELAFHVAMREGKYAEDGLTASAATRKAKHDLGGIEKWKEALRDVRRPRALENFIADIRLAVRLLRKSPAFTVVALATLTLAIGANTAVFTLLDTLLLRPLPVPQADRLVLLSIADYGNTFSYPGFRELEKRSPGFSSVCAFYQHKFQLHGPDGTESVPGVLVSGGYFSTFGVPPEKGRWIGSWDDRPSGGRTGPVAVVSDRLWKTRFNGDPAVIGRKMVLGRVDFTIVGVMPAGFFGIEVGRKPDIFVPLALEPEVNEPYSNIAVGSGYLWLPVGARLRDGESLQEANSYLRVASKSLLANSLPNQKLYSSAVKHSGFHIVAESGATGFSNVRFTYREPLLVMMILVVIVLCVACLNLASLLMARSAARERELATRFVLGAGRRPSSATTAHGEYAYRARGYRLGISRISVSQPFTGLLSYPAKRSVTIRYHAGPARVCFCRFSCNGNYSCLS